MNKVLDAKENWLDRLDQTISDLGKNDNMTTIQVSELFAKSGAKNRDHFAQAVGERISDGRIKVVSGDPKSGAVYCAPDPIVIAPEFVS